jgi:uncharacterized protein YjbJ (UPF0337 family)
MNREQIKGNWNQMKGAVKQKWGQLTDDDLVEVEGDYDRLVGKIQERTGDSAENIKRWMDDLRS